MNNSRHNIRLDIIRNNEIVSTAEHSIPNSMNDFEITSSSGIHTFPIISIKSSNSEINSNLMSFSNSDILRLSVSESPSNQYKIMFEGEFRSKTTKIEGTPKKLNLDIEAIHSFYKLSLLELSSVEEFVGINFGEFVRKLLIMTKIDVDVVIGEQLSQVIITGVTTRTNAFRLFKEVCIILGAKVTFNTDNTVEIDSRERKLDKIRGREVHTLKDKDIISSEKTESI